MIGVLALQGGFAEHLEILKILGIPGKEVRAREELMDDRLRGLIIPGGESTVMAKFIDEYEMRSIISVRTKNPAFNIYGTCAGLILLAGKVMEHGLISSKVRPLGLLDVDVERNAYGRQLASFVTDFGAFIRAPKITRVGSDVEIVQEYEGAPVLVRRGNIWASTFHPELINQMKTHRMIFTR